METQTTFAAPAAWRALLARIEARTGKSVDEAGLFGAALEWTADDLDDADRLLGAIATLAEMAPEGLDADTHAWATQRRHDVREARWWQVRRRTLRPRSRAA